MLHTMRIFSRRAGIAWGKPEQVRRIMVIFGASGDLTRRLLVPALCKPGLQAC
jgi:hypothetical protein